MKSHDVINILGTIVLSIGMILALLPHAFHTAIGLDEQTPHSEHVAIGFVLIIVSLLVLGYNNNAFTFWKRQK